jgi:hypothetical protein
MSTIDENIAAFNQQINPLEAQHMGKWVVFHDSKLVDIFDNFELAASDAVRKFGRGPYLVRQIGAPPVVLPASVAYHPISK